MHEDPKGEHFIAASKKRSTKLVSKAVTKVSKTIYHQMQSFHNKSHFYPSFKEFWVIESSKPIIEKFEKASCKANVKDISSFDFSTLYTKLPKYTKQTIGIPMSIDPPPIWAYLYLSKHEYEFMNKLIEKDFVRAKTFMELSDLLMVFEHSMMEDNLKVIQINFTQGT